MKRERIDIYAPITRTKMDKHQAGFYEKLTDAHAERIRAIEDKIRKSGKSPGHVGAKYVDELLEKE